MIKKQFKYFLFLTTLLWASVSFARILFVSDIDDTIKIAQVKSVFAKVDLAFETNSRFKGMSELYNALENEHGPSLDFFYLSNAPSWLMQYWHEELLEEGQFPLGLVQLREDESEDMHKVTFLRQWIKALAPTTVILVGDNGERDALFYHQIADEFTHTSTQFLQFIRIVYDEKIGHKLLPNQVGFVTPIEIALKLIDKSLLSEASGRSLIKNIEHQILNENSIVSGNPAYFPEWLACPQWQAPLSPLNWGTHALSKVAQICGVDSLNLL